MWDGRDLPSQIRLPLEEQSELNINWDIALATLSQAAETRNFLSSCGGERISKSLVILALASYVRSLVTLDSPFDRYFYRNEDGEISDQAKEGLKLFIGKGGCSSCHQISGSFASFTDYNFHSVGVGFVNGHYLDKGRFEVKERSKHRHSGTSPYEPLTCMTEACRQFERLSSTTTVAPILAQKISTEKSNPLICPLMRSPN